MCSSHGVPGNKVHVTDSQDDSRAGHFGRCGARAPCQAERLSGVVTEMDDGAAGTSWIKIDDAGHVWTITTQDLEPFPFREGSAVSASYLLVDGGFAPSHSALELRVNGELAFYYGFGGGVDDIDLPREVTLERGAASCETFGNCLSWSEYDVRISVDGGEPVTLRTGEAKLQNGYLVKNFRSAQGTARGPQQCADAFVADTTIFVAHRSLLFEAPDAGSDAGAESDRCVLSFDTCPAGCAPIQARTFDAAAAQPCLGSFQTIGCFPAGTEVTDDDRCAKSPDGHIVGGLSGTLVARLISESGYVECSRSESEAWNALSLCMQP